MKRNYSIIGSVAIGALLSGLASCNPDPLTEADVFTNADAINSILQPGDSIYHLDDFVATFMTEEGNFLNDSTPYRTRSTSGNGIYLFSIDTIPAEGNGIYIRGRVSTDDYGGNFYKSIVIQEIVDGKQQNLRLSVDIGSANGLYQTGQELLIRCNGLSIGRYANQPQLCVPSYNNNIYASNANQKVGWAPGRIPSSVFNQATTLIGTPDQSKLVYDTIEITDYFKTLSKGDWNSNKQVTQEFMQSARQKDGMLVCLKDVHFTGQYEYNGNPTDCSQGDPEEDTNANVFAPTTKNVGYPQGRIITDGNKNYTLVSTSEYAKFARFYLPAEEYVGTVTGVLGFYADHASNIVNNGLDGYEWSITVRNINISGNGSSINDVKLRNADGEEWIPEEYKRPEENASDSTATEE